MNDVLLNKSSTIHRCLRRIHEEFNTEDEFRQNFTKQDSVLLNIQRACEAAIDIANYLIRAQQLGIPQSSRDSFALLSTYQIIPITLADNLQKMVGLRNIAVHDYQALNLDIVIHVIRHRLSDFEQFTKEIARYSDKQHL
ncbi:type VII toxin-antitoxin system HepT family RNase toxin [Pectobacterium sp. B1J-3]|uniref:type VII toxin-antitoxin system HepT family RNase toxin n=1 Tax=Pectobacterium sp. B1J-3 TaxID=3385371 RepID=UPI0039057754